MRWLVVYTVAFDPGIDAGKAERAIPKTGDWLAIECESVDGGGDARTPTLRRWVTLLNDEEWTEVGRELRVPPSREPSMDSLAYLGVLPSFSPGLAPTGWQAHGAHGVREAALWVSPLPQDTDDLDHAKELLARVAWNVGDYEVELRCPDCSSPDVEWMEGPEPGEQMACGNCSARFARGSALLTVDECESLLPRSPVDHATGTELALERP